MNSSGWTSRKLWVTIFAILVAAGLVVAYVWALVVNPEAVTKVDTVVAATAAIAAAIAGAVYVVTEGRIDLRALPTSLEPIAQAALDLSRLVNELRLALTKMDPKTGPPEDGGNSAT